MWESKPKQKGALARPCQRDLPPQTNHLEEPCRGRSEEAKGPGAGVESAGEGDSDALHELLCVAVPRGRHLRFGSCCHERRAWMALSGPYSEVEFSQPL